MNNATPHTRARRSGNPVRRAQAPALRNVSFWGTKRGQALVLALFGLAGFFSVAVSLCLQARPTTTNGWAGVAGVSAVTAIVALIAATYLLERWVYRRAKASWWNRIQVIGAWVAVLALTASLLGVATGTREEPSGPRPKASPESTGAPTPEPAPPTPTK